MKLQNKKGFTLIELLVVITIIGILATGAVATYTSQIQKARDTTRTNDIKALQSGIEQVYQDAGAYPAIAVFGTGVNKYVERFPTDSKSGQACVWWSPCDYLYSVKADGNGITNQNYNISTGLENTWNVEARANNSKDGWVMDLRLEFGVGLATFTATTLTWGLTGASCSIPNTWGNTTYMIIKWNCN